MLETSLGRILVDPMLRPAGSAPPIENTPNQRPNPLVELPFAPTSCGDGATGTSARSTRRSR